MGRWCNKRIVRVPDNVKRFQSRFVRTKLMAHGSRNSVVLVLNSFTRLSLLDANSSKCQIPDGRLVCHVSQCEFDRLYATSRRDIPQTIRRVCRYSSLRLTSMLLTVFFTHRTIDILNFQSFFRVNCSPDANFLFMVRRILTKFCYWYTFSLFILFLLYYNIL